MSYLSHADLGGSEGCGPVIPEPEDERFHAAWEPRALALTLAMGATGAWNIDMSRSARETLPDYAQGFAFAGAELWGDTSTPGLVVSIDAWEPYLEPA
jgi:hypothetical protein